jgi:hypothetical protein
MPAGFSADGLPLGVELLGRPLDDARLVALAYAFEQATRPRRPPEPTPPLVRGRAPEPLRMDVSATGAAGVRLRGRFYLDVTRGTLDYAIRVQGVPAGAVHAVTLDRMEGDAKGAVLQRLSGPGQAEAEGSLALPWADRQALAEGRITVNVYTAGEPAGAARARLVLPRPAGR